jgi:hypothetical protein
MGHDCAGDFCCQKPWQKPAQGILPSVHIQLQQYLFVTYRPIRVKPFMPTAKPKAFVAQY